MTLKYKLHPFFSEIAPLERRCDYEGCPDKGEYKAPRSRAQLRDYYWFCLIHIRLYNGNWNYYQGMDAIEVEQEKRRDETWQRPTWPFTQTVSKNFKILENANHFFDTAGDADTEISKKPEFKFAPGSKENRALITMNINYPYTQKQLKIRYLELAKKYHPDMNQGSREAEEYLKEINLAYEFLKNFTYS